ncbi:hypothetical protein RGI145_12455 [Roseomonas gilardii]|uniref:Uncharacterized protein n=1 Tax=Roseomonas gilardii TaxID=257708 RepID=A0A1L7AG79_9PROT|nr:hypothetical protein [Roseomonas gilardii]APT57804.1 hypothetical protein RGI145_12455 [Roseomonas gilardii]
MADPDPVSRQWNVNIQVARIGAVTGCVLAVIFAGTAAALAISGDFGWGIFLGVSIGLAIWAHHNG